MAFLSSTLLLLAASAAARDITFPPVSGYQSPLGSIHTSDIYNDPDVSAANFGGLTTFANLPYVHCLSAGDEIEKYDIAILGAPFDTVRVKALRLILQPSENSIGRHCKTRCTLWSGRHTIGLQENASAVLVEHIHWYACHAAVSVDIRANLFTGQNIFGEWAKIVDCGDAPLTVLVSGSVQFYLMRLIGQGQYACLEATRLVAQGELTG